MIKIPHTVYLTFNVPIIVLTYLIHTVYGRPSIAISEFSSYSSTKT